MLDFQKQEEKSKSKQKGELALEKGIDTQEDIMTKLAP